MHPLHSVGTNNKTIRDAASFGYHEFILQLPNSQDRGNIGKEKQKQNNSSGKRHVLGLVCRRNCSCWDGIKPWCDLVSAAHSKVTGGRGWSLSTAGLPFPTCTWHSTQAFIDLFPWLGMFFPLLHGYQDLGISILFLPVGSIRQMSSAPKCPIPTKLLSLHRAF